MKIRHYWGYCNHCECDVVICGGCGNNTCNGGYGSDSQGNECTHCPSAYNLYLKGVRVVLESDQT